MPKKPIDYSNALIYSIICKTDETLLYIGSTTNFRQRKKNHKNVCNNENSVHHNLQVYVMMRANGGWDNFNMTPVKEYSCENKIQLVIEEERIRKEMNANLNTHRAYLSLEERREDRKKYQEVNAAKIAENGKKYYEANAAKISEYGKKYYEANTAKIAENNKKYYEANTAKIAEDQKKYYEANTAKIAENRKKYQKANAAKINERKRRYYQEKKQRLAEQNKTEK
jgi:hypothetical protein